MGALDQIVAFGKAVGSALVAVAGAVPEAIYSLSTIGDFPDEPDGATQDGDDQGEQARGGHGWGPLGWFGRPLDPDADGTAEAAALRAEGQLNPFGWRDLRLVRALGGQMPAKGQTGLGGYGGGFLVLTQTAAAVGSKKATIATLYVPHDFNGSGVPQKAHVISIDPTPGNSSISIVHASGTRVCLTEDTGSGPGIVASVDGATFLRMSPGELTVNAEKIMLKGNVYLGAQAELGIPIALSTLAPSPSVFGSTT